MLSKVSLSTQDTDKKVCYTLFCSYQYLISECFLISHFSQLEICSSERASKTGCTPKFLPKSKVGFLRNRIFKNQRSPQPESLFHTTTRSNFGRKKQSKSKILAFSFLRFVNYNTPYLRIIDLSSASNSIHHKIICIISSK